MPAFGSIDTLPLPAYQLSGGISTEFGTLLPPGGRLAGYVRSTGPRDYDPQDVTTRLYRSLKDALRQCRAGAGDVVIVLAGHQENISTADYLSTMVAGTRIIGQGSGRSRPTFTWTTQLSSVLLARNDCVIDNCVLNLDPGAGTVNVAAPITVSAPGCAITNCDIRMGTDVNSKVTIGITTTVAGDDLVLAYNRIYGATAAECTTMIQLVGADRLVMRGNTVVGATSAAAVGVVRFFGTASTDVEIIGNRVRNNKALSSQAITGMAGLSGFVDQLFMGVLSDAAAALTGAFSTPGNLMFGRQCYVANNNGERGALFGTESA